MYQGMYQRICIDYNSTMLNLRTPTVEELDAVFQMTMRAKASWGYDAAFMEQCIDEMTINPQELESTYMRVAEDDKSLIGLAQLAIEPDYAELVRLYVEPDRMGTGAGRHLFNWAADKARSKGMSRLIIESDTEALPFYIHMGAVQVGYVTSGSIAGRKLPKLELMLI
jgi:GNAT superfamily N-acetyltransferase